MGHILTLEWLNILLLALVYMFYLTILGIYRVYLSPLAKFPGPRLAALTTWYQAYYDIYLYGQFFKKLDQLHQEYGPIVRINPHEVHINDPAFIDVLFTNSQPRNKYKWIGRSVMLPNSIVATISHDLHRKRRAALSPYFSKTSIRRLEPMIQEALADLLKCMKAVGKEGGVMVMGTVYRAVASDIITAYSFGTSTNYLKREDYNISFFKAMDANFSMAWPLAYISWLGPLVMMIPPSVMGIVYPGLKPLWKMHRQWTRQIEEIRSNKDPNTKGVPIFHGLLNSNLPPSEKTPQRLRQEAQLIIFAGQDTVAYTLSAITYELLANPDKLEKLKAELAVALPSLDTIPPLAIVEKLPYLNAVIQEGLRLYPAGSGRMTRVAPEDIMVYRDNASGKEWAIPPRTPTAMAALPIHMNSSIFPEPTKFEPERWLENPRLDRYLMAFSKGSRICLGFHLAYSELYILLAGIFRKYNMYDGTGKQQGPTLALYDTRRERDVAAVHDFLVACPARGSQGVRLTIRE